MADGGYGGWGGGYKGQGGGWMVDRGAGGPGQRQEDGS